MEKPGILMISKPVVPPWHDSGKNLVRDIASAGERYRYHLMATKGAEPVGTNCVMEAVYSTSGIYAAGVRQNSAVLRRLLKPDRLSIYHFFFAPNKMTSTVARGVLTFKRRRTVHTICSIPRSFEGIDRLLFADRIVTLSRHTQELFERHSARKVVHIPPCIPVDRQVSEERKRQIIEELDLPDKPLVLFAGDYQFSDAAAVCVRALPRILGQTDAVFVFACRIKQEQSREIEARVKSEVEAMGLLGRVRFFNEVSDMEALAAAVTLNVLPADSLYAKMDIPLVLLESLREEVPVVVSDHGPLKELLEREVGASVPTGDHNAFSEAVIDLLGSGDRCRAMGREGRRLVEEVYSPGPVGAKYEELYDSLLGETRKVEA